LVSILWEQKAGVAAVFPKTFAELRSQHELLFPRLEAIPQDDQANSRDASPSVN